MLSSSLPYPGLMFTCEVLGVSCYLVLGFFYFLTHPTSTLCFFNTAVLLKNHNCLEFVVFVKYFRALALAKYRTSKKLSIQDQMIILFNCKYRLLSH